MINKLSNSVLIVTSNDKKKEIQILVMITKVQVCTYQFQMQDMFLAGKTFNCLQSCSFKSYYCAQFAIISRRGRFIIYSTKQNVPLDLFSKLEAGILAIYVVINRKLMNLQ